MPLDATAAAAAADALFEARRKFRKIAALPESCRPVTEEDGYAVQAALVEKLTADGSRRVGYKIGATNPAARAMLGTAEPFSAVLVSSLCHDSQKLLLSSRFHVIIIEPEIALRLGRDLPADKAPYTAESAADAVDAVAPAIEIVTSPFPVWNEAGIGAIIADNGANGGWVCGRLVTEWQEIDLPDVPVMLRVNDRTVAEGAGRNVDGGPLAGLAWLANHLAADGRCLRAGEFVTTGSTTAPTPARGGQSIVANFGPLGNCWVRFA